MNGLLRCVASVACFVGIAASRSDPLVFFRPDVTITEGDRRQLDRGEPIARPLDARGAEVAVFAAVPVAVDADRFVGWIEHIEQLKKSEYVPAIHRFSTPPTIDDLAGLTLDSDDRDAIAACEPDDCALKLSADEVRALRRQPAAARDREFRSIVLARVARYLATGEPVDGCLRMIGHSPFLTAGVPELVAQLHDPPHPDAAGGSFLYWSQEHLAGRSIVIVTDVRVVRSDDPGRPAVLVAGKEIFWSRYLSASLGVTALMRGRSPSTNYLVYVNRSEVDAVHGFFGGIIRWAIQRRLAGEAAGVLRSLRIRLEGGEPK